MPSNTERFVIQQASLEIEDLEHLGAMGSIANKHEVDKMSINLKSK